MDGYNLLLLMLLFPYHCKAFVFTSSPNATTTTCDRDTVTFNWIYSSGSANSIAWTKLNDDSTTNATLASFSVGSFIPDSAYGSRVTQVGNAGITLSNVTPADDGIYQVEVADFSSSLKGTTTTLTVFDIPSGAIRASYSNKTNLVKCDGLSSLGYGSLSLMLGGSTIWSNESLSLEYASKTGGKYCCCVKMRNDSARCLPAGQSYTNCSAECVEVVKVFFPGPDGVCDPDPLPIIAVIILVILLVLKLITDVLFVGYRWESKIGVKYTQICKRIISTVKKEYILYWSCFIQGIIGVICGVAFLIVMCIEYTERLEEGLHVAVLVICIIILSIGVINIVMCLCCSQSHKSTDHDDKARTSDTTSKSPSSWLCCCCPVAISPEKESAKRPPPPIPAAMASPRKPVPPNSTSARPLPSPTSEPTSDSAVKPSIPLDPLDVEEPTKKKKKKRKNRKKGKEAGGESSDPPVNTGDSDD
ncbi:uncharacterized protein [Haliotis asinina]|uniref:uncharacterized protein isoform X2 n=1 Tax=Haliotis asinina TaxID=109174 RepID=UPI003531819A